LALLACHRKISETQLFHRPATLPRKPGSPRRMVQSRLQLKRKRYRLNQRLRPHLRRLQLLRRSQHSQHSQKHHRLRPLVLLNRLLLLRPLRQRFRPRRYKKSQNCQPQILIWNLKTRRRKLKNN
jgi:hypothetical protein